jgi:hypothetical protein
LKIFQDFAKNDTIMGDTIMGHACTTRTGFEVEQGSKKAIHEGNLPQIWQRGDNMKLQIEVKVKHFKQERL